MIASHAAVGSYPTEVAYYSRSPFLVGAFGVDILFGLSGLLITLMLLDEARELGGVRLKAFYIGRAFRILPPALAYIAAVTIAGCIVSGQELAGSVFFFRNYVPFATVSNSTQQL